MKNITLDKVNIGHTAKIVSVGATDALRQHLLDMGLIPGADVVVTKLAPLGDPMQVLIHGYELTLRLNDASKITVGDVKEYVNEPRQEAKITETIHPGLGEYGKFHDPTNETHLDKNEIITFALAGNQNCGKTTLFNQLTGSNQHVGNFPGVTVDRKSGKIKGKDNTLVVDLPGIYSLSPYSDEEIVSREYILNENPKGIINIIDGNNIERNLYLTMQLIELDKPMALALNMIDEVNANGGYINVNKMESMLGIPIVPISAKNNEGVDELVSHAIHVAYYKEKPLNNDFCLEDENNGAVHRAIHSIMCLIEDHAKRANVPLRFASTKLIEGDTLIKEALALDKNEEETIEHIVLQMEEERGLDRQSAIADMRYSFIYKLCKECVIKPQESKEHKRSTKIDKILTGKYTAIPMFILIMCTIFFLTFNVIGLGLQNLLDFGITSLTDVIDKAFTKWSVQPIIHSLVVDGIFSSIGSVISFLPIIIVLFFFLSILEDSGYMARVAFVMDKLLRKIGLSGKSIVPMLIGFGCTVPGVMSTRTLSSDRDRKMTVLLTPFMSCSAKLPIYSFICSIFFKKWAWLMMCAMYILGILIAILVAFIAKKLVFKGEAVPFIMELPNYRAPGVKNVLELLWEKTRDFLKRAFSVILIATIVIWFLQSFDFRFNLVDDPSMSILAKIAGGIAVLFKPLGFGDYRYITSLISGFLAKESVVATMSVLIGPKEVIMSSISTGAAVCFLVFCLLYTPCIAAIASIRKELGHKWAIGVGVFQLAVAYIIAGIFALIFALCGVL